MAKYRLHIDRFSAGHLELAFKAGWNAALTSAQDGGWRPIAEAPRDGTWILAYVPGALIPAVVQWQDFSSWPEQFHSIKPRWLEEVQGAFEDDDQLLDYITGSSFEPRLFKPIVLPPTAET